MRHMVVMVTYWLVLIMTWRGLVGGGTVSPCNQAVFSANVNQVCIRSFGHTMEASGYRERCPWPAVKGPYNTLVQCIDNFANVTLCSGWKYTAEGIYMDVHDKYFSACGAPIPLRDPPLSTLVLLISPGVLFTFLLPLLCLRLTTHNREMPGFLGL